MTVPKLSGAALAPNAEVSPELERFKKKVEDFRQELLDVTGGFKIEAKDLSDRKNDQLYATLQEGFVIATELMQPENTQLLDDLLKAFGLSRDKRKNSNPWMAAVNLLFVKRRKGKTGQWVVEVDKSAKKYAPMFYYMNEKNVPPDEAADYIKTFEYAKEKKLKGLEAAGRDLRGGRDPDEQEQFDEVNQLIRSAVPLALIERDELTNRAMQDGEFILLYGQLVGRHIAVLGEMHATKGNHSRVAAYLYQAAREAFIWTDKRVGGMENGKGCMPPRRINPLWADKLLEQERKQPSERHMKKLAERAIKGGKHHPQHGDKKLAGKPATAPKKPATAPKKPAKRSGVKVGGKVQVEKQEATHAA